MAILFESWIADSLVSIATFSALLYLFFKYNYLYWERRGVLYMAPTFPFGNCREFFFLHKSLGEIFIDIYQRFEGEKVCGFFQLHRPVLIIRDVDLIKNVLVKNFASFQDRGVYVDEVNDPLQKHLFAMGGPKWKPLRAKLTPTFTSGKMKMMFPRLADCGDELNDCMKSIAARGDTVEIQDILGRFSTDIIVSCAFGIECDSLKNPESEFRKQGKAAFHRDFLGKIGLMMLFNAQFLAKITKLGNTPTAVAKFFINLVKETVEYREKNNVSRNDFMQLLIQLKNKGYLDGDRPDKDSDPDNKIDILCVAAQAFVFFLAGFETSSATMAFCLLELAVNPEIQAQLRQEIDSVLAKHDGRITYESLAEMEYLDQVVFETLRKYPALPGLNRECNTACTLPGTTLTVEPGVMVIVPIYALHHDPQYYPEPQRFDPGRFTKEEKAKRNPYTYLPFGEGPRICIGMRFGWMMTKIGLISLLKSYEFRVSAKTVVPVVIDPALFVTGPKGGIYLQVVERSDQ